MQVCLSTLYLFKALSSDSLLFSFLYTSNCTLLQADTASPPIHTPTSLVAISLYHLRYQVQEAWILVWKQSAYNTFQGAWLLQVVFRGALPCLLLKQPYSCPRDTACPKQCSSGYGSLHQWLLADSRSQENQKTFNYFSLKERCLEILCLIEMCIASRLGCISIV